MGGIPVGSLVEVTSEAFLEPVHSSLSLSLPSGLAPLVSLHFSLSPSPSSLSQVSQRSNPNHAFEPRETTDQQQVP